MSCAEDLQDFEEQLRLQNSSPVQEDSSKTRVDPDGSVMEWDEKRKAWFPKIDDDFIARYQMTYGISTTTTKTINTNGSDSTNPDSEQTSGDTPLADSDWAGFNAKLASLREQKGENSKEVQQLTKSAHEALNSYYDSAAYREWYVEYCRQQSQQNQQQPITTSTKAEPKRPAAAKTRYDLKPSDRVRNALSNDGEDADIALTRAEAEQEAGVPVPSTLDEVSPDQDATEEASEVDQDGGKQSGKRKTTTPAPAWYEIDDEKNTHVYVTGLPPDITESEFQELVSKYGIVMNEPFTNKPRVKLYLDENGKPKGDGRCCYVKVESVDLALKLLDGMIYAHGYTLHVERAKFQPKGTFDPKKRRRLTVKEKKKLKEQQENLFRWGIDTSKFVRGKKERVLVLQNAFDETHFVHDVTLIPLVRDRLKAQCAKCGIVKKIVVYDTNPKGVVAVTFSTAEEADTALPFLDKALFAYPGPDGARQLEVERWDGKTSYALAEDQSEEKSRLQNWEEFLGGDSSDDENEEKPHPAKGSTVESGKQGAAESLGSREEQVADYWETLSQDSPASLADTDEAGSDAGGSSGDETS